MLRVLAAVTGITFANFTLAGLAALAGMGVYGEIEWHANPVVSELRLADVRPHGSSIMFTGTVTRLRPECDYRRSEWFRGRRGEPSVPIGVTPERPVVRPDVGEITLKDWLVDDVTVYDFINTVYGDVYHQCYWLTGWLPEGYRGVPQPWLTKTPLWR